jgi:predicted alpha/beta-hydrolase family hydrolase
LFVHGIRDRFGSIEEMREALNLIPVGTELLPVDGAGHELVTQRTRDQVSKMIGEKFRSFTQD